MENILTTGYTGFIINLTKKVGFLMKLSSKARYGLKACLALAENYNENQPLALPVFAEKAGVTEAYMEQIVILLKKADIVESVRGAGGGYYLTKSPDRKSVV